LQSRPMTTALLPVRKGQATGPYPANHANNKQLQGLQLDFDGVQ